MTERNESVVAKASEAAAVKAEGELRRAAGEALKRNGLPDDLIERTKTLPGSPFEHRAAFAKLPDADRANLRKAFKVFADFPVGDFDRLTAPTGESGDDKQGRPVEWDDPEPWPDPVDGAVLLSRIAASIRRHVWLDESSADALALWAVMTWIHDRLEISTFANLTSATKQCGKSLLLEVLAELAYRPMPLSGQITAAPLFRIVEAYAPTLMLDEADTYMRDDDILRGVVNGSQRRALAYIPRCVGDDHEVRNFATFCPKLIAGIGGIHDTVRDRSLVVRLERKPAAVRLDPWRERDCEAVEAMRGQIVRWAGDHAGRIVEARSAVTFPRGMHDRARDAWESLLAIANAAGGEWAGRGARAWKACEHFAATSGGDEGGAREMLLADLYAIFEADGMPSVLSSATIVERLVAMESRPWSEWKRGKEITPNALARLLKPFEIAPRQDRKAGNGTNLRGYQRADLESVWDAYFPHLGGFRTATPLHSLDSRDFHDSQTATGNFAVADANVTKPVETRDCSGVAVRNPRSGGNRTVSVEFPKQPAGTMTAGRGVPESARWRMTHGRSRPGYGPRPAPPTIPPAVSTSRSGGHGPRSASAPTCPLGCAGWQPSGRRRRARRRSGTACRRARAARWCSGGGGSIPRPARRAGRRCRCSR